MTSVMVITTDRNNMLMTFEQNLVVTFLIKFIK